MNADITREQARFLKWLDRKTIPSFTFEDWVGNYSELIDALYAHFKGWDKKDFKNAITWPDVHDELAN